MVEATGFDYCAFASVDEPGETYCVESESARLLLTGEEPLILPMLLVEEAGGRVTNLHGGELRFGEALLATNGLLHNPAVELLAPTDK